MTASAATGAYPASTSTATSSVILQLGESGIPIAGLQALLMKQGYLSIVAPTGYFGSLTQAAVMASQQAQGVPQTGIVTIPRNGLAAFFASAASPFSPLVAGGTGADVGAVQNFLIHRGYLDISTSTSYFGSLTKAAVIAFQKAHNLPQTGIVDRATFFAMNGK